MTIVHNEQRKYIANAFDRASTSCLTVGVFAPIAAAIYAPTGTLGNLSSFAIAGTSWLLAAAILHWRGRVVLRSLL